MTAATGAFRSTDPELFAALEGGADVIDWYGGVPSFHDATLLELRMKDDSAILKFEAMRITSERDANGYFLVDRRAQVIIKIADVTGIRLSGNARAIVAALTIRRIAMDDQGFDNCAGPRVGDFEVCIESVYGLEGSVFGRNVSIVLAPSVSQPG